MFMDELICKMPRCNSQDIVVLYDYPYQFRGKTTTKRAPICGKHWARHCEPKDSKKWQDIKDTLTNCEGEK